MNVLFYGAGLIFIAFFIHLVIWKLGLPKNQTRALLEIFFGTLIIGILLLGKFSADEYLQLSFFFIALTLAYIATYSALAVDSPTLVIMMNIAQAGSGGLDKNILEQKMSNEVLILPRLKDLLAGEMVYLDGKVYKLKLKGAFIARIFIAY